MASALALLAGLLVALLAVAPAALAAPDKPSKAHQLEIGVTYSSSIPDEDENDAGHEWLRLPGSLNPGDEITFATETDTEMRYCLVPDVDDYQQLDVEEGCDVHGYTSDYEYIDLAPGKYRRTMKWTEDSSQGFLLAVGDYDCCSRVTTVYSVKIEEIKPYEPDLDIPEPDEDEAPKSVAKPMLTAGPKGRTSQRKAAFQFSSNHDGGRFQCKLTGQRVPRALRRWRPCTSPKSYTSLNLGKKVFWLRELDGGVSSPPVRRAWTVTKAPIRMAVKGRTAAMRLRCSKRRTRCRGVIVVRAGKYTLARGRYSLPAGRQGYARLGLSKAGLRTLAKSKRARGRAVFIELPARKRKARPVVLVTRDRS